MSLNVYVPSSGSSRGLVVNVKRTDDSCILTAVSNDEEPLVFKTSINLTNISQYGVKGREEDNWEPIFRFFFLQEDPSESLTLENLKLEATWDSQLATVRVIRVVNNELKVRLGAIEIPEAPIDEEPNVFEWLVDATRRSHLERLAKVQLAERVTEAETVEKEAERQMREFVDRAAREKKELIAKCALLINEKKKKIADLLANQVPFYTQEGYGEAESGSGEKSRGKSPETTGIGGSDEPSAVKKEETEDKSWSRGKSKEVKPQSEPPEPAEPEITVKAEPTDDSSVPISRQSEPTSTNTNTNTISRKRDPPESAEDSEVSTTDPGETDDETDYSQGPELESFNESMLK